MIYHFVKLDDQQTAHRRHLLDKYGQFAQLSILIIPLVYQLIYALRLLSTRLRRNLKYGYQPLKQHSSPVVSRFENPESSGSKAVGETSGKVWRNLKWALGEEIFEGWGTRQEWLVAGVWAGWLGVLAVRQTGDDYLHITKRFGIIAASQLPLHYALALKSWSPIQYLTRLSHEQLNTYHRLLGRIIYTFFFLHATFYLNFFIQMSLLTKRLRDWDVILGLSAISTATLLLTGALQKIRDRNYRIFFYSHVFLSITLLPILYLHVSHLRIYILETAFIYALLILQRNHSQTPATATITLLPGTNLLSLTIPLKGNKYLRSKTYHPGQHIYIGFPALEEKLRINPFSIANPSPLSSQNIQCYARVLSGTTALLASLAKLPQPTELLIEGPYGSATYFPDLASYDRVLFVAGGVGATFTLPIFKALMERKGKGEGAPKMRCVWSVRGEEDAGWGVEMLGGREEVEGLEVFVTGAARSDSRGGDFGMKGAIELQEREDRGALDDIDGSPSQPMIKATTKSGRPNLAYIVDEVFQHDQQERIAVLVCGPKGMGKSVRREVGRWVWRGRDVFWHGEEFGW